MNAEEAERLKQAWAHAESLEAELVACREENDTLRTALQFYANEENYHAPATVTARPVLFDLGERARAALGTPKGDDK